MLIFRQNSYIISNFEPNKNNIKHSNSSSYTFSKILALIYNTSHVIDNKPVSEDFRNELKYKMLISNNIEKSSEKTISYMNLISKSPQFKKSIRKPHSINQGMMSKIFKKSKNSKYYLLKYDAVKGESSEILLESFLSNKVPSKRIAIAKVSGYFFIYDNQGVISVLSEKIKICELVLPDCRLNPTLFVHEIDMSCLILLVLGGSIMNSGNGQKNLTESIAVYYLDLNEAWKFISNQPILYIKMKYARMSPIVLEHKQQKEKRIIILGGNIFKKSIDDKQIDKKKSIIHMFNETNLMCETIRVSVIKEAIYKTRNTYIQTESNIPIIPTEDSLCLIVNGNEELQSNQKSKLKYYFGEGAALRVKDQKKKQLFFFFGLGKNKNRICCIDMFDFIEHKAYIYFSQSSLKKEKERELCNCMFTRIGHDICYLDDNESLQYKKMTVVKIKNFANQSHFEKCLIF